MNKISYCHESPRACVRIQTYAYTYMGMHTHVRVQETMKEKFSTLKFVFWNESHIVWEPFQTSIFEL